MRRRVAVTGMGGVTSLGTDWPAIRARVSRGETGIRRMPDWDRFEGLNTRLGAPVVGFDVESRYERKKLRTMGPVSRMAVFATENALRDAGLLDDPVLESGRTGIAYGSSFGSAAPVMHFAEFMSKGKSAKLTGTSYVQMMSHTAPVNIGLFFRIRGRIIPTSSACTSGSQGIGFAAETIRYGLQDVMIAGGAEELCAGDAAVFDTLYATSQMNDSPSRSPRPFDRDRDGLVLGEGAATLILEDLDRARARGAKIHAEIVGFGTNADGVHVTQPSAPTMERALRLALEDAALPDDAIGCINAHGTATEAGDVAESIATAAIYGSRVPIHALKSYFGHTLGACGSIEAWLGIEMMKEGWFAPTANLETVDSRCAELDHIAREPRRLDIEYLASNNFAFGGINTSLIIKRV